MLHLYNLVMNSISKFLIFSLLFFHAYEVKSQFHETTGANYCNPTFASGCTNWRTISVNVGQFTWSQETSVDCETSDFLLDTIRVNPGMSYNMEITNANWCGTGVWVDFGQDFGFDTSDNVFRKYEANETNIYQFNLTIPDLQEVGNYRIRVITGWGTDCYSPSNNGFGPCGDYEYGNFQDFMLKVSLPTSKSGIRKSKSDYTLIQKEEEIQVAFQGTECMPSSLTIYSILGNPINTFQTRSGICLIPTSVLPNGMYMIGGLKGNVLHKVWICR